MKKINKIKIKVNGKLSTINNNLSLLNYIKNPYSQIKYKTLNSSLSLSSDL